MRAILGFRNAKSFEEGLLLFSFALLPLWWVFGFDLFIFHIVAVCAFLSRKSYRSISTFEILILLVIFVCSISSILAAFSGASPGRIFSAAFNISNNFVILAFALLGFTVAREGASDRLIRTLAITVGLMAAIAAVTYTAYAVFGLREVNVPTLLGLAPQTSFALVSEYQSLTIFKVQWFNEGFVYRAYVFSPFATASAFVCNILLACFFLASASRRREYGNELHLSIFLVFAVCFYVGVSLTRTQMVALPIIIFSAVLASKLRLSAISILALVSIPVLVPVIIPLVEALLGAREGSNSARFASYSMAQALVLENSPLIGIGLKPTISEFLIPIGSHSSVLSYLVRGGLIASLAALIAFVLFPLKWALVSLLRMASDPSVPRFSLAYGCVSVVAILIFYPFGEMDAYPIVSASVGLFLGLLRGTESRLANLPTHAARRAGVFSVQPG